MKIIATALLPLCVLLFSACSDRSSQQTINTKPSSNSTTQRPAGNAGGGGLGSENDGYVKPTYGTGTTKAGAIGCAKRRYLNYSRARLVANPDQADVDTFEASLGDGKENVFEIAAGTKVTYVRPSHKMVTLENNLGSYKFWRVRIDSGPHAGKSVNVYDAFLTNTPESR